MIQYLCCMRNRLDGGWMVWRKSAEGFRKQEQARRYANRLPSRKRIAAGLTLKLLARALTVSSSSMSNGSLLSASVKRCLGMSISAANRLASISILLIPVADNESLISMGNLLST